MNVSPGQTKTLPRWWKRCPAPSAGRSSAALPSRNPGKVGLCGWAGTSRGHAPRRHCRLRTGAGWSGRWLWHRAWALCARGREHRGVLRRRGRPGVPGGIRVSAPGIACCFHLVSCFKHSSALCFRNANVNTVLLFFD